MTAIWTYLSGVVLEGLLVGVAFWIFTYIVLESTSLWGAIRAGICSEAVGNLPYLAGITATDPPTLLTTLIGAGVFVWMIVRVGELTAAKSLVGLSMTYFFLVALVTCAPQ